MLINLGKTILQSEKKIATLIAFQIDNSESGGQNITEIDDGLVIFLFPNSHTDTHTLISVLLTQSVFVLCNGAPEKKTENNYARRVKEAKISDHADVETIRNRAVIFRI